jgi:hypothetical protein
LAPSPSASLKTAFALEAKAEQRKNGRSQKTQGCDGCHI